jgi:transcriptional regulator with XRE-family HTH domain
MATTDESDQTQFRTLGAYLKRARTRIDREALSLGPYERLASRRGRRVTQEEVAETVGVSRVWYATLEAGAHVRASMRVIGRLADILTLNADERVRLFQLAIPELQRVELSDHSVSVLEALSFMRAAAKRLWSSTSEIDALLEASEQLASWFRDVPQIGSAQRLGPGIWDSHFLTVAGSTKRFEKLVFEILASFTTAEDIDEAHVFPQLIQPGETGLVLQLYSPPVRRLVDETLACSGLGCGSYDSFTARVRSRGGLIACLGLYHETRYNFSETDRAILSTLAELTSLALS